MAAEHIALEGWQPSISNCPTNTMKLPTYCLPSTPSFWRQLPFHKTTKYLSKTKTPPSSSTETSTLLLLFALSAKLWIDHYFRTHAHNCCCNQNIGIDSTRLDSLMKAITTSTTKDRTKRNRRGEHHFHRGEEVHQSYPLG